MADLHPHVHRIELATPFAVGSINCYVIDGEPLTLVDTGVKSKESLEGLRNGLQNLGYEIGDIGQILITHGHVDHIGLANTIAREAKSKTGNTIPVRIHTNDEDRISDYELFIKKRVASYIKIIKDSGVPPEDAPPMSEEMLAQYFNQFGESAANVKSFEDNAIFETGIGTLQVVWVPGHSLGSSCFVSKDSKLLFSGDHILGDISSNPSLDYDVTDRISMLVYFESLKRMKAYDGYIALPGHRELMVDLNSRIVELERDYDSKFVSAEEKLDSNPKSIYSLSRELYGDYDSMEMILALAETQDLYRTLEERGKSEILVIDGINHVRAT
ncbi:MAG: MBL fold metallo-hydrolase [Candidatus Thorarchaeota archaeon]